MAKYWVLGADGSPEQADVISWGGLADCWATLGDDDEVHCSELFDTQELAMEFAIKIKRARLAWLNSFNGQFDVESSPQATKDWLRIIYNENIPNG